VSDNSSRALHLEGDIAKAVDNALSDGAPILLSYVDGDGQPHLSYRGTTQVHSDTQLALWARDANGGLPRALANNPRVTLLYRHPETRTMYIFYGTARVEGDEAERNHIFDSSPEREQQTDPERKGVAIVVDVNSVQGRTVDGPFTMTR
jgi:hypothetical protein